MKIGYDLCIWEEHNIKLSIRLPISSHIHFLITGSSGSGKSIATLYLLLQLANEPNTTIWFYDFKNSKEFSFLKKYDKYRAGDSCIGGIEDYYNLFNATRKGEITTKETDKILRYISEILMLGRGTENGFGLWAVCQRAMTSIFLEGSRDNFMCLIALGRISKELKNSLFSSVELEDRIYKTGEGIILADGKEVQEIKFPFLTDFKRIEERKLILLCKDNPT